jgi:type II secretory pathway pseudopilin PulG
VELIAVIIILGVLAAVAIPKFVNAGDRARIEAAVSTLKVMMRACQQYEQYHGIGSWVVNSSSGTVPTHFADFFMPGAWQSKPPLGADSMLYSCDPTWSAFALYYNSPNTPCTEAEGTEIATRMGMSVRIDANGVGGVKWLIPIWYR